MIRPESQVASPFIQSGSGGGGAAERLLQYGQSLIDSSDANPISISCVNSRVYLSSRSDGADVLPAILVQGWRSRSEPRPISNR